MISKSWFDGLMRDVSQDYTVVEIGMCRKNRKALSKGAQVEVSEVVSGIPVELLDVDEDVVVLTIKEVL